MHNCVLIILLPSFCLAVIWHVFSWFFCLCCSFDYLLYDCLDKCSGVMLVVTVHEVMACNGILLWGLIRLLVCYLSSHGLSVMMHFCVGVYSLCSSLYRHPHEAKLTRHPMRVIGLWTMPAVEPIINMKTSSAFFFVHNNVFIFSVWNKKGYSWLFFIQSIMSDEFVFIQTLSFIVFQEVIFDEHVVDGFLSCLRSLLICCLVGGIDILSILCSLLSLAVMLSGIVVLFLFVAPWILYLGIWVVSHVSWSELCCFLDGILPVSLSSISCIALIK